MPAPLDVDDEIGGVVRRALPIPYVGGSRIQPSSERIGFIDAI